MTEHQFTALLWVTCLYFGVMLALVCIIVRELVTEIRDARSTWTCKCGKRYRCPDCGAGEPRNHWRCKCGQKYAVYVTECVLCGGKQ